MDLPAVLLLLFTPDDPTLEDHASEFLVLTNQRHYHNSALISFSWADLNSQIKKRIPLPDDSSQGEFKDAACPSFKSSSLPLIPPCIPLHPSLTTAFSSSAPPLQPLSFYFSASTQLLKFALGFQVSSSALVCQQPWSTSGIQAPDSTSAFGSNSSASPWSIDAMLASDIRVSGYALTFHPSCSAGLLFHPVVPLSSLQQAPPRAAEPPSPPRSCEPAASPPGVTQSLQLLGSAWISASHGSTSVGQTQPGSILAPPSIGSTIAFVLFCSGSSLWLHPPLSPSLSLPDSFPYPPPKPPPSLPYCKGYVCILFSCASFLC